MNRCVLLSLFTKIAIYVERMTHSVLVLETLSVRMRYVVCCFISILGHVPALKLLDTETASPQSARYSFISPPGYKYMRQFARIYTHPSVRPTIHSSVSPPGIHSSASPPRIN